VGTAESVNGTPVLAGLLGPLLMQGTPSRRAGAINISASFAPENRDKLRAVIRDELKQRTENGFSSLQVSFARRAILSSRADFLAQNANVANVLANDPRWGRDMGRWARFTEVYEKLETETVNAAGRNTWTWAFWSRQKRAVSRSPRQKHLCRTFDFILCSCASFSSVCLSCCKHAVVAVAVARRPRPTRLSRLSRQQSQQRQQRP
jgi:hypothetical protein